MIFLLEAAYRETFWNIKHWWSLIEIATFAIAAVPVALLIYGLWRRLKLWRMGQPERFERFNELGKRLGLLVKFLLLQKKMFNDFWAGTAHALIFFGFCILFFLGAVVDAINLHLGEHILRLKEGLVNGPAYLTQSAILEVGGFMLIFGVIIAALRRYVARPKHLEQSREAAIILALLLLVAITGFAVEGMRIEKEMQVHPGWSYWSFGGYICANIFSGMGLDGTLPIKTFHGPHVIMWWIHTALSFGLIGYIGFSKLRHMFTSAANIFLQSLHPRGEVPVIEKIEEQERWGTSKIEHYTWKQLLDLDACTRCGRCEANCPATQTEKPLNPKKIIGDSKAEMERVPRLPKPKHGENAEEFNDGRPALVGEVIKDDEIWACTTCLSCLEHCPVEISAVDKIIDMRRYLVLMESRFPAEMTNTFKGMETNSNPYNIGNDKRLAFLEGREKVNVFAELDEPNRPSVLYYAGCANAFDPRNQKVALATIRLLKKAGVDFAMLGPEENCCGETARRMGNEYIAQSLMLANVETFKKYGVKTIITGCPHCFNTFKNEYKQFGAEVEVISHILFLMRLINEGKLKPAKPVHGRVLYHDSCYLGRHNGIYEEPRAILHSIPELRPAEFERNRNHSFCCGAGGGRMWMEEKIGKRINEARVKDGLDEGPNMIAVACPYCMTMFTDGLKAHNADEKVKALDIAEILLQSVE
jgi:Fe-S oxidoreductase/uncharacterized membrane protein